MRTDQAYTGGGDVPVLAVSLELAAAKWKVALHDGRREKPAVHTVAQPQAAVRLQAGRGPIERPKGKWSLPGGGGGRVCDGGRRDACRVRRRSRAARTR